jgi:hypothetical protein
MKRRRIPSPNVIPSDPPALAIARELIAIGHAVFICDAQKEPIFIEGVFEHGFHSATRDPEIIAKALTIYRGADIGLSLPPGVMAVDVDAAHGKNGREVFIRLFGCAPEDMPTAVHTTPRGGFHVFLRHDPALDLVQRALDPAVDTRVGGQGYVVAPSLGNGRRPIRSLLTTELMEAPPWLVERLLRAPKAAPCEARPFNGKTSPRALAWLEKACNALREAPPTTRDRTIGEVVYRAARLAANGELDAGEALAKLKKDMAANVHGGIDHSYIDKVERCFRDGMKRPAEPGPIDDKHAEDDDFDLGDGEDGGAGDRDDGRHADRHDDRGGDGSQASETSSQSSSGPSTSAGGAQSASARAWLDFDPLLFKSDVPPPDLGDDALPDDWADLIRGCASLAAAPPDYVAITSIVGAAGAIGNSYVAQPTSSWREPASLWGAPVGVPGSGKTPGMNDPHRALIKIDGRLFARWKEQCEGLASEYQTRLEIYEDAKRTKKAGKAPKPPKNPPFPQLLIDDITIEQVAVSLSVNPHGLVAIYNELGSWFSSFDRYSSDAVAARSFWIGTYDVRYLKRDRVKIEGPPIIVPLAACSILGGVQPDRLRDFWRTADDGILERFIFVWPRLTPLQELEDDDDYDLYGGLVHGFRTAFAALYDLPANCDADGVPHPVALRLTKEARVRFSAARMDCVGRARHGHGVHAQWLAKGPGRILRLALVFELMAWSRRQGDLPTVIGLDALERAIRYSHYAEAMLRRTIAGLEPTGVNQDALTVAKRVVEKKWLHFTNHDVGREPGLRWFRGESREAKQRRDNALAVLTDSGAVRPEVVMTGRGPIQKWEVRPDLEERLHELPAD